MAEKKLSVITISITTFDEQGRLDEDAYRKHMCRLRDGGVSVYVGGSGSGEGYSLTPEENARILAIAVEELKGKTGIYADGVEPRNAKEMISFMRRVENSNVDAVRIMPLDPGHGSKPNVAELEKYHCAVIESTAAPLILTSHDSAGYILPIDLIERLANRYPHVYAINYGGKDTTYLAELIKRMSSRLVVHCAGCTNGLATLTLGGHGFMGNEGNLTPALAHSVITAFESNDRDRLRAAFGKLMSLAMIVQRYGGSSLRGLKPALKAFGLPGGPLREPRLPLDAAEVQKMVNAIIELQIPELAGLPKR
jgi:4-hydroxy-tetrahydrodipicolinate synthase